MSIETWVQLGAGIVMTIAGTLLGEQFWKSLALTLGDSFLGWLYGSL